MSFLFVLEKMKLPENELIFDQDEITGFDGHKSQRIGRIYFPINLMGKEVNIGFFLIDCESLHNCILGSDWSCPMDTIISTRYQCLKFRYDNQGTITNVKSNQWLTHQYNGAFLLIKPIEVKGNTILTFNNKYNHRMGPHVMKSPNP